MCGIQRDAKKSGYVRIRLASTNFRIVGQRKVQLIKDYKPKVAGICSYFVLCVLFVTVKFH